MSKPKTRKAARPRVRPHHLEQAAVEAHACPAPFAWIDVECQPTERFETLEPLARRIHALRGEVGIRLEDIDLERGLRPAKPAVLVFRVGDDGGEGYMGCALVNGHGRHALEAALRRTEPGMALAPARPGRFERGRLVLEGRL